MDPAMIDPFFKMWTNYFPGAELPIVCYYTEDEKCLAATQKSTAEHCLISQLQSVRDVQVIAFSAENIYCSGGNPVVIDPYSACSMYRPDLLFRLTG